MSLTSSPSSLLIMCPYHLNLASLTFSAMSTTPHLLISSFHNVSDQLSFISSYYVSISSQPCFPYLLCNVYYLASSDLFIPLYLRPTLLHHFLLRVHIISTLLPSSSLQYLPPRIFWSLHSIISLTSSPSSLLIMCPYHLNLASLTFSAMSTTSHHLISSFHYISDQLSFIISYYVSISSQPCFPHLLCLPTSFSDLFIPCPFSETPMLPQRCEIILCNFNI